MATINELIKKAQTSNSPQAYEQIANMYLKGNGVPQNHTQALSYYLKAANLGSVHAQACVGMMYYNGYGVAKNIKLAKQYLLPASERGSIVALRTLGRMCYNEEYGLFAAKGKAFTFWMKASKLGDAESQLYVASSYLGDSWGEEMSYYKAAFWYMCAYQNRRATQNQINEAKDKLNMLSQHVNLNSVKAEVLSNYRDYLNL